MLGFGVDVDESVSSVRRPSMSRSTGIRWLLSQGVIYAAIALLGLAVLSLNLMTISLYDSMLERNTPLVNAASNIKFEVSRFHLWFEEALATGDAADLEQSWQHLKNAEDSAQTMLGENERIDAKHLVDTELRQQISHVLEMIVQMRTAAKQRLLMPGETGIGTPADREFDAVYNEMLRHVEHVSLALKRLIDRERVESEQLHGWISFLILLMTVGVVVIALRSDRRQREHADRIRESEQRLRLLMENANDAIFLADAASGVILDANQRASELIGMSRESIVGMHQAELHPPEEAERYRQMFQQHVANGTHLEGDVFVQHWGGRQIPVEISASVIDIGGKKIVQGIFRDISERLQAEAALKKYEDLFSQANDLAYICDTEGKVLYVNSAFDRLSGHRREEFIGKQFAPLFDQENLERANLNYQRTLAGESPCYELAFKETGIVCEYKNIPYKDQNGNVIGVMGIARDVTERLQMESALRSEKAFSDSLVETAQSIVLVLNPDGSIRHINPFMEELSGYKLDEVAGRDWFDTFLPKKDWSEIRQLFKGAVADVQTRGNINPIICKDGSERQIQWYDKTLKDSEGNTVGLLAIGHDVTESQRLEASLAAERNKLLHILNSMTDGIYIVDQQENVEFVNRVIQQEFGLPEGRKCYEYLHGRDAVCPWCPNERVFQGETVRWEWQSPVSGNVYDLIDTPIRKVDGSMSKLEIFRDITEHKKADEALERALAEKEVLLREIHHRVKNNLQVVSSLLSLHANVPQGERDPAWLRDAQGHIRVMSLVHDHLYKPGDLAQIDFSTYANRVVDELSLAYDVNSALVKVAVDVEEVRFGMDLAVPLGLVLCELFTNSVKYAFPDGRSGTIDIALRRLGDGRVELKVADDGVGLPPGFDWQASGTIGFELVQALVAQLEGEVDLSRTREGVCFAVRFNSG